jgi:hypothetical protein
MDDFQMAHAHRPERLYMGLGDVVAAGIKKVLGIKPCGGCQQRQQALNSLAPRVWPRR